MSVNPQNVCLIFRFGVYKESALQSATAIEIPTKYDVRKTLDHYSRILFERRERNHRLIVEASLAALLVRVSHPKMNVVLTFAARLIDLSH